MKSFSSVKTPRCLKCEKKCINKKKQIVFVIIPQSINTEAEIKSFFKKEKRNEEKQEQNNKLLDVSEKFHSHPQLTVFVKKQYLQPQKNKA